MQLKKVLVNEILQRKFKVIIICAKISKTEPNIVYEIKKCVSLYSNNNNDKNNHQNYRCQVKNKVIKSKWLVLRID